MFNEFNYQPVDLDDELFLSEAPLDLIMNAMKIQFDEPLEYRKTDHVQSFITKYEFSKENMLEDDQDKLELYHDTFMSFIEKLFDEYLGIGFVRIDDMGDDEMHDLVHLTYRFFIKNIKKNFISIISNYIRENKETLESRYERKKDVTTLAFKAEIDNDYDILILSNLGTVIDDILLDISTYDDVDEFFRLCEGDEPTLELEYVTSAYNKLDLSGNFIEKYVEMVDDDFRSELQSKIRNKILKKYGKRKIFSIDPETTENNEEE